MSEKPLTARNRKEAEKRILKAVKIYCKKCHAKMIRYDNFYKDAVGYGCEDCSHTFVARRDRPFQYPFRY